MDYATYLARMQHALAVAEQGDLAGATAEYMTLVDSDISDPDKANICLNLAVITARQQRVEESLAMHDLAERFEERCSRYTAIERKAGLLQSIGRTDEAVALFERLQRESFVLEQDKERYRQIVQSLRG